MSERERSSDRDSYRPRSRERDPERGRNAQSQHNRDSSGGRRNRDRHRPDERYNGEDRRNGHSAERERERRYRYERDSSGSRYKYREENEAPYPEDPPRYKDLHVNRAEPRHYAEKYSDAPVFSTSARHEYPQEEMEYYEPESSINLFNCYKCGYFCTGRALCQAVEILINLLLLICAGVFYSNSETYLDVASLGGVYAYYYGGANTFTGAEAEKVKQLDSQFYQLKLPVVTATMAFAGALLGYCCLMVVLGVLRIPFRCPPCLLLESALNILIGLGYIPCLAFYFLKLQEVYNSQTCQDRQQMYSSKGIQGYSCGMSGTDIAGGLFGVIGIIVFPIGAILAIRAFRRVQQLKQGPQGEGCF
ncbi:MARVEL domain-containing protein 3 isoform X1 [Erpetoichthys calabaricus]|uniref:MARVEL domain-containing protein n=1 Tax=Erpetoichthys calabaricus TaxID=27687 RepID=A0A8C4SJQ2_ERPCA|nr:MARVEL domain-containing protein 3 isoform X1 [Erpetoichthys calabaricus]XP_028665617.1 MARVEL domain-containing protein 3 isoform X1 [Erpetoichthys calabaricus]